jgi:HEAT repeat protein/cyclophilin family peptidyl-prolyl cis-trans isomerase
MKRILIALTMALGTGACASAPPKAPGPTYEQQLATILRFEDQRILRDPAPPPPPVPTRQQSKSAPIAPPPPDLIRMLGDSEARVRRRAALAAGRIGLRQAVPPLVSVLSDPDPEVRQMAAFALGLLGDARAKDPLVSALHDQAPVVQASSAEALGLLGDPTAADPIARMLATIVQSGPLAQPPTADDGARRDTPAAVFRLGLGALVRLKAYEPLASVVLDSRGEPLVRSWPVAYALASLEDRRAEGALLSLAKDADPSTRAFAISGLGSIKAPSAVPVLLPLLSAGDSAALVEAIRALGRIGDPTAAPALVKLAQDQKGSGKVRLEAIVALGSVRPGGGRGASPILDTLLDSVSDPNPAIRAAALRATAEFDPDAFLTVVSGLDPDPDWHVRAALASVLGGLPAEVSLPRLTAMLGDTDQRVIPSVLASLVKLRAPRTETVLMERLTADDPVVRASALTGIRELKPAGGAKASADAYEYGRRDSTYVARAAALEAVTAYGGAEATAVLKSALADKDWAVRVRAAALLRQLDPATEVDAEIRPAPTIFSQDVYEAPRVISPPFSTHAYLDTDRGSIQVEFAVLDAPLTVENFISLARKGYFDGLSIHRVVPHFVVQDGDPRGDGEGSPGYTIRDELNERLYVRGTVGMALDWPETGGSQFFITCSPQPRLDAKYTAFGRVVSGMDVVDALEQGDVIRRVRVWDGQETKEP